LTPDGAREQDGVVARPVVARRHDRRFVAVLEDPFDGARIEVGPVGEDDERGLDVVSERAEAAAQRRAGSAGPVRTADDRDVEAELVERVCTLDDDHFLDRRLREAFENRREEDELLRRSEARRRAGREHDRCDHDVRTVACSISTTSVGCSFWSPSLPILSTTSSPLVTLPMIAWSGGSCASAAVTM